MLQDIEVHISIYVCVRFKSGNLRLDLKFIFKYVWCICFVYLFPYSFTVHIENTVCYQGAYQCSCVHTFQGQDPPARPKNYIQVCLVYMFCIYPYSFTVHIEYTVQYCIRFIRPSLNATLAKYFLKSLLCLSFIKYVGIRSGTSSMCQICKKYNILVCMIVIYDPVMELPF